MDDHCHMRLLHCWSSVDSHCYRYLLLFFWVSGHKIVAQIYKSKCQQYLHYTEKAVLVQETVIMRYLRYCASIRRFHYRVFQDFVPFIEQRKKFCSPNRWVCEALQVNDQRLHFQHNSVNVLLKSSNCSKMRK